MVYLEAQAQGCPVLAEDRPGVREVVRDGGWLVRPDDPCRLRRSHRAAGRRSGSAARRRPQRAAHQIAAEHLLPAARATLTAALRRCSRRPTPLIAARLALLRHGHTAWNRAGRMQGRIDEPLDDRGARASCQAAAARRIRAATLLSSPLVRAVETAPIVGGRAPLVAPALIEMDWGAGKAAAASTCWPMPIRAIAISRNGDGISSRRAARRREWCGSALKPWLASIAGRRSSVTHVGVMRVMLARATGWNFDGPAPFRVKRDRLYRIDVRTDGTLAFDSEPVRLVEAGSAMKRITILVTHLLGTGHLSRALTLARAFRDAGLAAAGHLGRHAGRSSRCRRASISCSCRRCGRTARSFTRLLDDRRRRRRRSCARAQRLADRRERFARFARTASITELFPFGRRVLQQGIRSGA